MICFDEHPFERQERRRRASTTTFARFGNKFGDGAATQPTARFDGVIRPVDQTCRHCAQREPLAGSKFCASCLDMKMRLDKEAARLAPGKWYFIGFTLLMAILLYSLSGWMNPTEIKTRSENKGTVLR